MKRLEIFLISFFVMITVKCQSQTDSAFFTATGIATFGWKTPTQVRGLLNLATIYQPLSTNLTSIGALANTSGYLKNNGSGVFTYETPAGGSGVWGAITGTLSDQTDLQSALNLKGNITSQTFVTPNIGVATATSVNKITITQPANGATLTIPDGVTLNAGAGGTLGSNAFNSTAYVPQTTTVAGFALSGNVTLADLTATNTSLTFSGAYNGSTARTIGINLNNANTWTAAQTNTAAAPQIILGANTTTLGSIKMFGNTSGDVTIQPTAIAGTATVQTLPATTGTLVNRVTTANGVSASNSDGALTVTLGAITPTTVNGNTFTTGSSTYTGTAGQTYTLPTTTATIARTDAAQTFTGSQTFAQVLTTNNAIAASGNAATVPVTSAISTVTNNSAATLTITLTTSGAIDGQQVTIRILDASAVAQTITWVNTENSGVAAPTTSNGSTTLPLTVVFRYNNATSKFRVAGYY
jgi:hypothetical protein